MALSVTTANLLNVEESNPDPPDILIPDSDGEFCLELVVHERARTSYREGPEEIRVLSDSIAAPVSREIRFPMSDFALRGTMRRALSRALEQDEAIFHGPAWGINEYLRNRRTPSFHVRAEIEVVVDKIEGEQGPIEEEGMGLFEEEEDQTGPVEEEETGPFEDDDSEEMGPVEEEELIGAIERLMERCGLDSGGRVLGTCSVCLEDLSGDGLFRAHCSHLYHGSCIESWLMKKKSSCPFCRSLLM